MTSVKTADANPSVGVLAADGGPGPCPASADPARWREDPAAWLLHVAALRTRLHELCGRPFGTQDEPGADMYPAILEAFERLVLDAARADARAEAAESRFDSLVLSSRRDELTGLPGRALMRERMHSVIVSARRRELSFAVLFLDIDRFKEVNDTLGHAAGDEVLKEVGRRLSCAARETDTVSRHGGDEFVVMLCELSPRASVGVLARKMLQVLQVPIDVGGRDVRITASVGISLFPDDAPDGETLIALADAAMYTAKQAGGDRHVFQGDTQARQPTPADGQSAGRLPEARFGAGAAVTCLGLHLRPLKEAVSPPAAPPGQADPAIRDGI